VRVELKVKKYYNKVFLYWAQVFICLISIIFTTGCAVDKFYKNPQLDAGQINTIAVLPFENFTNDKYAGDKMKEKVVIELFSRGFEVIEEGEIARQLKKLKVKSSQ